MPASLRACLTNLIDYAGLFPPASLPLEPAIRNYAAYQQHAHAWMLGRFICPAAQLAALAPFQDLLTAERPLTISALGPKSPADFSAELRTTLAQIEAFHAQWGACGRVEALELTLPAPVATPQTLAEVQATLNFPANVFYEVPFDENWLAHLPNFLDVLAAHNANSSPIDDPPLRLRGFSLDEASLLSGGPPFFGGPQSKERRSALGATVNPVENRPKASVGFKLRTGGVMASAFPSTEQVAAAITACRERGLALKCTAGLHHPLRHFNESVQTKMHGFINVFGAGLLAHAHALSASGVQTILEDEAAADFKFTEAGFSWCGLSVETETIAHLRQMALISFGSCSFDEPREDLKVLGWLNF